MTASRCLFDWSIMLSYLLGVVLLAGESEPRSLFETPDGGAMVAYRKPLPTPFEASISVGNLADASGNEERRKLKRDRVRRKKEKRGRGDDTRDEESVQMLRNNEKDSLVRNRTIEILKSGAKILSAGDQSRHRPRGSTPPNQVNQTILEKILSSAASKPGVLVSASGLYKVPVGGNLYPSRETSQEEKVNEENNHASYDRAVDYEYYYDGFLDGRDSNGRQIGNKSASFDPDPMDIDNNIKRILKQIAANLRNVTDLEKSEGCTGKESPMANGSGVPWKDPCLRWLECRHQLESAFSGSHSLPSCPCTYPSTIFYNDAVWDENQNRYFRWRDASGEAERLDIYKPGATYCIRSLMAQGGASISSQQCCYDRKLRLLTRGSGAGTVNYVSPDVSKILHDTVDVLPWRLCKGDFTRYNIARKPDNGNDCPANPNDEQYELQVKLSKHF